MNSIDITDLDSDWAKIALVPYMAHPDDKDAREQYGSYLVASIEGDDRQARLVEAAAKGVAKDFENAVQGGSMAGDVLLIRMELIAANIPDPGLDKAWHIVSEYYGGFHDSQDRRVFDGFLDGTGKPFKAGRDTVRNHWKKFRNSAHLWAAVRILTREAEDMGQRNDPNMWLDSLKLAGLAMGLKQRADGIQVSRKFGRVLPTTAFSIVGVAPIHAYPPQLNADILEALSSFSSRYIP